ncbi:MAG: sigma factor [Ferruginibacter sp.]
MLVSKRVYSHVGDSDLFRSVKQNNDLKAFEELYNRYWPTLVNSAYKRLNSKKKAEDIVQNIFVDVYHRRTTIDLTVSFKAYLNQELKFRVLNEYRSELIRNKLKGKLF